MPKKYNEMLKLKFRRIEKNLTQSELAEKVGVESNTISYYETGWRFPRRDILEKLSQVLECEIADII